MTGGKFTTGPVLRHVAVMTATGSIGLIAVFFVDALNLFYISLLGQKELAAAIGFAGTAQFFLISISVGFSIAVSALVSRALGEGDREGAARLAAASLAFMVVVNILLLLALWPLVGPMLRLLGASGETERIARVFLWITLPSTPLLAVGMGASGILRAAGDARRAMNVTLFAAIVAAIFDPLLILYFDLGVNGAAIVTILSRITLVLVGLNGVVRVHGLVRWPSGANLRAAIRPFLAIGIPATLTQLATPVGNAYVTYEIARFGDEAVAGWAVIGRLIPVVFGVLFALSGSVGPIIGQNVGAGLFERVRETIRDSLRLLLVYVVAAWILLALFRHQVAGIFGATGEAAALIEFFCLVVAGSFLFNGALFVANACFNNLGHATYSTLFNWGRATLGVVPFVWLGGRYFGATGVLAGWGLGAILFGAGAIIVCFRVLDRMVARGAVPGENPPPAANSPFSSGKAATLG